MKKRKVTFDTSWGRVSFYTTRNPVPTRKSLYTALKPLFRTDCDIRKATDLEWNYYGGEPNACCAVGCKEEHNGLWTTSVRVGNARFWISACGRHKGEAIGGRK